MKEQTSLRILILDQSIIFYSFIFKIYLSQLLKVELVRALLTFESTSFTFGHYFFYYTHYLLHTFSHLQPRSVRWMMTPF